VSPRGIEYLFLTTALLMKLGGRITAHGASARLGSLAPMHALTELGYDARTYSIMVNPEAAENAVRAAKRVVFGEMFHIEGGWNAYRRLLGLLRNPREQAIFSIADDKFDKSDFLEFYRQALPDCLAVTAVSERLAQSVRTLTSRPVLVSPEPYEGARGAPHTVTARRPSRALNWLARRVGISTDIWRVRLLWYGYPMNLPPLLEMLPALEEFSRQSALLLTCVTQPVAEIAQLLTPQRTSDNATLRVEFLPWSPPIMESAIAASDLILIPSDYRNPVTQAKSPNRLIAGLHGGRFVVAHPLPAYEPYAEFAWLGEDLCEGLRWAINHPREVLERIVRGQEHIDQKHSPEAVARFWLKAFHPQS
jgi:hypothetical protein